MSELRATPADVLTRRPRILIVTDGKMGDLAQCRGVARALGGQVEECVVRPGRLAAFFAHTGSDDAFFDAIAALVAPPDLVLASGRRTLPYLADLKRLWGAATFTVFLKDPRGDAPQADLVWAPAHDRRRGPRTVVTQTSPHGHDETARAKAAQVLAGRLADHPRPWLAVLPGGNTRRTTYRAPAIAALRAAAHKAATTAGGVVVVPSRRTPAALTAALHDVHPRVWAWDGTGENPYGGLLGAADAFLVTGDSHNMVSEVLATGRQVMVFRPPGLPAKFTQFLDGLEKQGLVQPPGLADFEHRQAPLDATPVIAAAIAEAMRKAAGGQQ